MTPMNTIVSGRWNSKLLDLAAVGLIAAGVLGLLVVVLRWLWTFTVDDAYITFRYAENLATGVGLTFNRLLPHAEGYTSVLWTVLMAIPHLFGWPVVLTAKCVGVAFTLITVATIPAAVILAGKSEPASRSAKVAGATIAACLYLSFPFCGIHAVSGMETALAAFLYALVVLLQSYRKGWATPFACFLLGLTRPEANIFCVLTLGTMLFAQGGSDRGKFVIRCLAFYVVPGAAYLVWRWNYYGLLFPLPFYIKSGHFGLEGLEPAKWFAATLAVGFTLPLLLALAFAPRMAVSRLVPILGVSAYLLTVNHVMGYGIRYFYTLVPALSVLGGIGIVRFLSVLPPAVVERTRAVVLAMMASALVAGFFAARTDVAEHLGYAQGLERAHVLLGRTLAAVPWQVKDPVLVIGDAGAVPYFSRMTTVDLLGLNDPFVATHFHEDRSNYVLSRRPAVVAVISTRADSFVAPVTDRADGPLAFYDKLRKPFYDTLRKNGWDQEAVFAFAKTYYL